jgi:hypothetical protein
MEDKLLRERLLKRRKFLIQLTLAVTSSGYVGKSGLSAILEAASKQLFPLAHAETVLPSRMIYIGMRSGVSMLGIGAGGGLVQQSQVMFPNFPYTTNQLLKMTNNLYLTPNSAALSPHADEIAITQGISSEGGHTALFNFWEGGRGQGRVSPIIELAARNTSGSILGGVHFKHGSGSGARLVTHSLAGMTDLTNVDADSFSSNFKKPTLVLSEDDISKVQGVSAALTRWQVLKQKRAVAGASGVIESSETAGELLNVDYQQLLALDDLDSNLRTAPGNYGRLAKGLGSALKAMSLNLVNSAALELATGDWHRKQDYEINKPHYQQLADTLAAAAAYLKATPEPLGTQGESLWDTTVIVIGTEFTRRDRGRNQDNGDGGSQGVMLMGGKVQGGYYGGISVNGAGTASPTLSFTGQDLSTGAPASNRNSTSQAYHTIQQLVGNMNVSDGSVLKKMIKG